MKTEEKLPIEFGKFRIAQTACIDTDKGEIVKKANSYGIEKKIKNNYAVIAFLNYDAKTKSCQFQSVNTDYLKEREDGLEEIIDKFADMIAAWHSLEEMVKEYNDEY